MAKVSEVAISREERTAIYAAASALACFAMADPALAQQLLVMSPHGALTGLQRLIERFERLKVDEGETP
jgi:hypothetical protein